VTSGTPAANTNGRRRVDRVLAPDYLSGLSTRSLVEVRGLRDEAEQEETDLSYLRRLLQGRIDILKAELNRRAGSTGEDLIAALPRILADATRPGPRGLGRHIAVEPSTPAERRRSPETLVDNVQLADLGARTEEELTAALAQLEAEEQRQSGQRRAVQRVVDACSGEITRRYRAGEASVSDLLKP
jgi:hypothetical protein